MFKRLTQDGISFQHSKNVGFFYAQLLQGCEFKLNILEHN